MLRYRSSGLFFMSSLFDSSRSISYTRTSPKYQCAITGENSAGASVRAVLFAITAADHLPEKSFSEAQPRCPTTFSCFPLG